MHGLQRDPIRAEGNLFFKGFMLLLFAISTKVSGDDRWRAGWSMTGVGGEQFPWTLSSLAEHLATQWKAREYGLH